MKQSLLPSIERIKSVLKVARNYSGLLRDVYKAHPDKSMVGMFIINQPVLLVRDPDIIKEILQTKFNCFRAHRVLNKELDPLLSKDPFFQNGDNWKISRGIFLMAFTSKKLRYLSRVVENISTMLIDNLDNQLIDKEYIEIEAKNFFADFTTNVGVNSLLGIENNYLVDMYVQTFRKMFDSIFEPSLIISLKNNLDFFNPITGKLLKTGLVPSNINKQYQKIFNDIIEIRKQNASPKNDILEYIINYEKKFMSNDVPAHAFAFIVESFETSSVTLSFLFYQLSQHQDIQQKVREEVFTVLEKFDNELNHDTIREMTYMDQVINESLRMFPTAGRLMKICTEQIELSAANGERCSLTPGDVVTISLEGLHNDPKLWDNPDEFNPDRFDTNSMDYKLRHKFIFLPFGSGQRMCPGMRMGLLNVKIATATILQKFVIDSSPKLRKPVKIDSSYFFSRVEGGAWIRFKRL
ncbi:hypothetical protein PV327_009735 [Microctonus hyperodae]|uniref:Cytochrome P450 n=1 Tax=Microctonus hyperodae TaxID=165561 RepID=A0AA39CB24_MICHY|nr:hypothetical protein PV327_009735 [Microctonus hyperodae]